MTGDPAGGRIRASSLLRKLESVTQALGALERCVSIKVILESQRPKHTWLEQERVQFPLHMTGWQGSRAPRAI